MIELLIAELKDPYIRENFRRLKQILKDLDSRLEDTGSSGDIINNLLAVSTWQKISANVATATTAPINEISINDFKTLKYIVSLRDEVDNKTSTFEITIKNENGSLNDTVFAKISGGIDYNVNAVNNSGVMELNITNNTLNTLSIVMARLIL